MNPVVNPVRHSVLRWRALSTLRARMLILVVLALSPAIGLILVMASDQYEHEKNHMHSAALRAVRLFESEGNQVIEEKYRALRLVSRLPQIQSAGDTCNAILAEAHRSGGFTNILRFDLAGELVCSAVPARMGFNVSSMQHFQHALLSRELGMSDYLIARSTGKPAFALAVPVIDHDGLLLGVVTAAIDLDWLYRLGASVELPSGSALGMFDSDGTTLMRYPERPEIIGKQFPDFPIVKAALAKGGQGTVEAVGSDNVTRLYAFDRVQSRGASKSVYIAVGIPVEIAYSEVNRVATRAAAGLAIVALLVCAVAWFGSHALVGRHIHSLVGTARRFGAGELDARATLGSEYGEISQLARTFDEMASTLQRRHAELQSQKVALEQTQSALKTANDDLEKRVALRTAELVNIKTQLESDIDRRRHAERALKESNAELSDMNEKLRSAQSQLLQSEQLASIGQLAAGVAHEINNPIGYVFSNLQTLDRYVVELLSLLERYEGAEGSMGGEDLAAVTARKKQIDVDFLRDDVRALVTESKDGISRVKKIVLDLKDFSHVGSEDDWEWANLHKGLESTLNIVNNELKYKARVVKEYGDLPEMRCLPSQLNQVFMNLLVNAGHASEGGGLITIRTGRSGDEIWVEIADAGCGIAPEHLKRIFDPFFTTKPVGTGTGLGLSLSYGIVVKHGGRIEVASELGVGSTFRVVLPYSQDTAAEALAAA